MKHNHRYGRATDAELELGSQAFFFEFTDPAATSVCVAGTFNDWQPDDRPMHLYGNGWWMNEAALAPGTYEYCLVVDGRYIPDPLARKTVLNPFGGSNSVLTVFNSPSSAYFTSSQTPE